MSHIKRLLVASIVAITLCPAFVTAMDSFSGLEKQIYFQQTSDHVAQGQMAGLEQARKQRKEKRDQDRALHNNELSKYLPLPEVLVEMCSDYSYSTQPSALLFAQQAALRTQNSEQNEGSWCLIS